MKLGNLIKEYRMEHKYSLREFAERCGISFAQVRLMEKGVNTLGEPSIPHINTLRAVAKGLGISLSALLEYCDDMSVAWDEQDVEVPADKMELINVILKATPEQLEKIQSIINLVMP